MPRADRRHFAAGVGQGPLGDVFGQIGAALELRQKQQDADQLAQFLLIEVFGIDLRPDQQLHVGGQIVDVLVAVDHGLRQIEVTVEQGPGRPGQRLSHLGEQVEYEPFDRLRHGEKIPSIHCGSFTIARMTFDLSHAPLNIVVPGKSVYSG